MSNTLLVATIVLLPLVGFLINGLLGMVSPGWRKMEGVIGGLATLAVAIPFVCTVIAAMHLAGGGEGSAPVIHEQLYQWISTGAMQIGVAYQIDRLSVTFCLIVTGVGTLIHLYSIGYMHGDAGFWRFMAYLNLFIFAMLNLILADSYVLLFLGWEGVGLASYLLIGFWYDRTFPVGGISGTTYTGHAAMKAFIMNRIGDFAFLGAMFILFNRIGSLTFDGVFAGVALLSPTEVFAVTLLMFVGATGKSAQIPLYTWLPDAMAGPTPVSALIHAATMVTAGIYLTARSAPLFSLPDATNVRLLIAVVGALTAIVAASIGLAQNDIKKVLAYSTVSQLGYMFLALGLGAYTAAVFHVMTHAFFKACLFLGSGSVIHGMEHGMHEAHEHGDPQDIREMGGLRGRMPQTWMTFIIATLAIAGIPPLAGFFSKDEILFNAFASGHVHAIVGYGVWLIGIITAFLTAFYMMRLTTMTFLGSARSKAAEHAHESPWTMTVPLWILAGLAAVAGFLGLPAVLGTHRLEHWLEPVLGRYQTVPAEVSHMTEWGLLLLGALIAVAGVFYAFRQYTADPTRDAAKSGSSFWQLLSNKWYADDIYSTAVVRPTRDWIGAGLWRFDSGIIDGLVNGTATLTRGIGGQFRKLQSGVVQSYAIALVVGVVFVLYYVLR